MEARSAAVDGGGGVGGGGGKAEARVGLFAAGGGFIENGAVDFRDKEIVATGEIEGGIGE